MAEGGYDCEGVAAELYGELDPYVDKFEVWARNSGRWKFPLFMCGELWSGGRPPLNDPYVEGRGGGAKFPEAWDCIS